MTGLEQWLPNGIQAATAVGELLLGMSQRRMQQAEKWSDQVQDLAGLTLVELRRRVEDDPEVAELVWTALEAVARTASDDKRYLLAQVAASALRGHTTPGQVDALPLLLRTVVALDSPHVTLLVTIGQSADRFGKTNDEEARRVTIEKLEAEGPGPADLLGPLLAGLERENLTQMVRDFGGSPRWVQITDYGNRFLDYLLVDAGGWPPKR